MTILTARLLDSYRRIRARKAAAPRLRDGPAPLVSPVNDPEQSETTSEPKQPDIDRLIFEWSEQQGHPELAPLVSARFEVAVQLLRRRREVR